MAECQSPVGDGYQKHKLPAFIPRDSDSGGWWGGICTINKPPAPLPPSTPHHPKKLGTALLALRSKENRMRGPLTQNAETRSRHQLSMGDKTNIQVVRLLRSCLCPFSSLPPGASRKPCSWQSSLLESSLFVCRRETFSAATPTPTLEPRQRPSATERDQD